MIESLEVELSDAARWISSFSMPLLEPLEMVLEDESESARLMSGLFKGESLRRRTSLYLAERTEELADDQEVSETEAEDVVEEQEQDANGNVPFEFESSVESVTEPSQESAATSTTESSGPFTQLTFPILMSSVIMVSFDKKGRLPTSNITVTAKVVMTLFSSQQCSATHGMSLPNLKIMLMIEKR